MKALISILLGILQGITEFFPVSSSGHLAFFEKIFGHNMGMTAAELHLFNVMVHLATAIAVIIVFWKVIVNIFKSLFSKKEYENVKESNNLKLVVLIITATIPTAAMGFFLRKYFVKMESNLLFIGIMFFATALMLFLIKAFKKESITEYKRIGFLRAIFIGIMQGLAISPGLSRSGTTIAACRYTGISREKAGEFSFLIAIPAILGAAGLEITSSGISGTGAHVFILGFLSAFITGYFALKVLLNFIKKGKLHYFGYYVIIMGIISIVLHWRGL